MTALERKEMEVLEYTELPRIPDEYDPDGPIWVRAIARVLTNTASESYAVVHNDGDTMPKFVKTFDASGIARVLNIYPYEYLPAASMPSFKNVQEIRDYVTKFYGADPETVKGMKKEQLLKALLRIVLRRHIAAVDEEKARLAERNTNDNNIQSNNE